MYFGRQVVRRSARTLRPHLPGSRVRASTSTPWQIAPTGLPSDQNRPTCSVSRAEPRYWRIPGACPPGSSSPSNPAGSRSAQPIVAANSGASVSSWYRALASGAAPSWPNSTPVSSRGSAAGTVPARSVAKTTWCPASRRMRHGTATSVTSKSRSGSGTSTRTGPSCHSLPWCGIPMKAEVSAMGGEADREFARLASEYLDDRAERNPVAATRLGDHRFDTRLAARSEASLAAERRALDGWSARLSALDGGALSAEHKIDAAMMADSVAWRSFELDELREDTWNPLLANPGKAIYMLLARDFAPLADRLAAVAGRLAAVPAALAEARGLLGSMPRVHLETAIGQFAGTITMVTGAVDAALAAEPRCAAAIGRVRPAAVEALAEHRDWLAARPDDGVAGFADPRIGAERFGRKLSLALSSGADADVILARAEADLDRVSEEVAEVAAGVAGRTGPSVVREVLDRLAAEGPDDATILGFCRDALAEQIAFVRDRDRKSTRL